MHIAYSKHVFNMHVANVLPLMRVTHIFSDMHVTDIQSHMHVTYILSVMHAARKSYSIRHACDRRALMQSLIAVLKYAIRIGTTNHPYTGDFGNIMKGELGDIQRFP